MKIVGLILVTVVVLAAIAGGVYWYRLVSTGDPLRHIVLAENVQISTEWTVINAEKVGVFGDDRFLVISIEKPLSSNSERRGIALPDGRLFNPELILVDSEGNEIPLLYRGSIGRMRPFYAPAAEQPPDQRFVELRIRSSQPLNLTKITWTYYYAWEMP